MNLKQKIIHHTLNEFEGGFSDHPNDKGSWTKYGITRYTYAKYFKLSTKQVTRALIKKMPRPVAYEIYAEVYYEQTKVPKLPEALQHIYFDMCVNHGYGNAVKLLQRTLKLDLHYKIGRIDGKLGGKTLGASKAAVEGLTDKVVLHYLIQRRAAFYEAIVKADHSQEVFLKGWYNRNNWFLKNNLLNEKVDSHSEIAQASKRQSGILAWLYRLFKK